jgi:purine-binding chemotaxis protein CheW
MKQVQPDGMKDASMDTEIAGVEGGITEYVTAMIGGQLFGLPIACVQDVFMPERMTRVPLASNDFAGVLNLRGRIVTAIDMRARLGLPKNEDGKPSMAVGVDLRGESYGLLIDSIGEVLKLGDDGRWLASCAAYPSPLARSALRRQTPEVRTGCSNRACPDLCGGCPVMSIPTAILGQSRHFDRAPITSGFQAPIDEDCRDLSSSSHGAEELANRQFEPVTVAGQ